MATPTQPADGTEHLLTPGEVARYLVHALVPQTSAAAHSKGA